MTPTPAGQNRLLPYLLVILVLLLAYVGYTRFVQRPRPAAVVQPPPAVAPAPTAATPSPSPEVSPGPAASPAPVASPVPVTSPAVPPRPSGRANPFAALVVERPAGVAAPPPPSLPRVPPPFFPGSPGAGGAPSPGGAPPPEPRLVGVLVRDGSAVGVVEIAQRTYIVGEGDVVEGLRVERIQAGKIILRRGGERVQAALEGEERP